MYNKTIVFLWYILDSTVWPIHLLNQFKMQSICSNDFVSGLGKHADVFVTFTLAFPAPINAYEVPSLCLRKFENALNGTVIPLARSIVSHWTACVNSTENNAGGIKLLSRIDTLYCIVTWLGLPINGVQCLLFFFLILCGLVSCPLAVPNPSVFSVALSSITV